MTPDIDVNRIGWNYWTPFTMFSYTTTNGLQGVTAPGSNGIDIHQQGSSLVASKLMAEAELYNLNGTLLRKASNATSMNVAGVHGPCLLRFTADGKTATVKIVVK